jgi:hypothetical protein
MSAGDVLSGRFMNAINSFAVIGATSFFLVRFLTDGSAARGRHSAADFAVIRWGLPFFVVFKVSSSSGK